jgi:hypothetical protein
MAVSFRKDKNTKPKNDLFSKVQKRAYEIYEKRGFSHGKAWNDWFEAERQVRKELKIK